MEKVITRELVDNAMSYASFRNLINHLLIERKTTGSVKDDKLVEYTRQNSKKMDQYEKQAEIMPELLNELKKLKKNQIWLGVVEGWCRDVPPCIAPLAKIASAVPKVSLRLVLRDEHPEVINAYVTDTKKVIPKIIALDSETLEALWVWGPLPQNTQSMIAQAKADFKEGNHDRLFFDDRMQEIYDLAAKKYVQEELFELIKGSEPQKQA